MPHRLIVGLDFPCADELTVWQFTKTYIRRDGRWQVAAYHASPAPQPKGGA